MARNPSLKELKNALGADYQIRVIDLEQCLYRDFGNGFNVEISGVSRPITKNPAILYLWFGDTQPECVLVKSVCNVGRSAEEIGVAVQRLLRLSEMIIYKGWNDPDTLWEIRNKLDLLI